MITLSHRNTLIKSLKIITMKKLILTIQKFFSVEDGYSVLPGNI